MPGLSGDDLEVYVRIMLESGLVIDRWVTRSGDNPLTLTCWLALGQYTVAADGEGLAGSTQFTVTENNANDVVRVELR